MQPNRFCLAPKRTSALPPLKTRTLAEEDSPEAAEAKAALASRLAELEKEIETAVEAEDYERADELNTAADGLRAELDALQ